MSFLSRVAIGESVQVGVQPPDSPSPVRGYRTIVNDSGDPGYVNRLLVGTATTGLVRIEWVQSRYGQIVPANWGMVQMLHFMDAYMPLRYQVDDAQNLIVKEFMEKDFEWLFLLEHDVILPANGLLLLNEWIQRADTPVVSGLYYTRSHPSEPLVYRGRGTSFYGNWKVGDLVWCDGVPTGCLLIHRALLAAMWEDAPEYTVYGQKVRQMFRTPRDMWFNQETGEFNTLVGTSDLEWCTRVMKGDYFAKSGWSAFAGREFPFVVDTRLFCRHINPNGEQFPN